MQTQEQETTVRPTTTPNTRPTTPIPIQKPSVMPDPMA